MQIYFDNIITVFHLNMLDLIVKIEKNELNALFLIFVQEHPDKNAFDDQG